LAEWDSFDTWKASAPDPGICSGLGPLDWAKKKTDIEARHGRDELVMEGLRHGHTFLQLSDIRGYQNLLFDFADEEPRLWELIDIVERFNMAIVQRCLELGVDVFAYPDDLGMQRGPMVSPEGFRTYIKPSYQRLMKPARDKGVPVHMHSDGDIRDLLDDLIDGGVDIINLQDLVNGIDFIEKRLAGKTCIELDIDRQNITVFGTPADVDRHIRNALTTIGRKEGGLMFIYGWYPGTPIENAAAVMDAMEKYAFYFSE
jgi:uroporphyrinogen-III decarboxylase